MPDPDTLTPVVDTPAPEETPVSFEETAIPETYKENPNISKYKNVGELVKGYENQSKLIGAKGVIVPKPDAPQEEKDKFLTALGRPVKPEEYKLTPVENLHPKIKEAYTPEAEGVFKQVVHKIGLTQAQADELHNWYFSEASKGKAMEDAATDKAMKDGEAALRKEWGAEYDAKIQTVQKMVGKFGGQSVIDALGDKGSHPAIVKMMAEISKHFTEDTIKSFGEKTQDATNSAKAKIKAIMQDKNHAYWNDNDPKHYDAIKEVEALYAEANPEGGEA